MPVAVAVMEIRKPGGCIYSCALRGIYMETTHAQGRDKQHVSLLDAPPFLPFPLIRGWGQGRFWLLETPQQVWGIETASSLLDFKPGEVRDPLPFKLLQRTCSRKVYYVNGALPSPAV